MNPDDMIESRMPVVFVEIIRVETRIGRLG
jgi:hypothetical protein